MFLFWLNLNSRSNITAFLGSIIFSVFSSCLGNWGNAVDKDGNYLIDRSPEYFEPLLNYLRNGVLILNEGVNPKGKETRILTLLVPCTSESFIEKLS